MLPSNVRVVLVRARLRILGVLGIGILAALALPGGLQAEDTSRSLPGLRWKPRAQAGGGGGAPGGAPVRSVTDPAGDTFGTGAVQPDILSVTAEHTAESIEVTVTFADPVELATQANPLGVLAILDIDVDRDPTTGEPGLATEFCPHPVPQGVDRGAALFGENIFGDGAGPALVVFRPEGEGPEDPIGEGDFAISGRTVRMSIPRHLLGPSGDAVDVHLIIGTSPEPTDCAPDGTVLTSAAAAPVPALGGVAQVLLLAAGLAAGACVLLQRRWLVPRRG